MLKDAKYRTRFKVSLTYLSIIMLMSVVFSLVIYNISDRELYRQRNIPVPNRIRNLLSPDDFDDLREIRLNESRNNLRNKLVIFNVSTLIFGSMLSYFLALKSLGQIEEALERQNRFTSDASHEIKTPLTAIRSEIEVTLRDKNLDLNKAKLALKSNLEEISRLDNLTSGLLQLARNENIELSKEKIDVNILLDEAIEQVKNAYLDKKLKFNINIKGTPILACEPNTMRQAIVIFLDNSAKYSPKNKKITIGFKSNRSVQQITIDDEGPGIDSNDLPYVFDRFYRSDKSRFKTNNQTNGYGLGLAIAKQIVESHKGHITIKSQLGNGTQVLISLPKTN